MRGVGVRMRRKTKKIAFLYILAVALCGLLVLSSLLWYLIKLSSDNENIFVSVASYRDPSCGNTIFGMFVNASLPSRLIVSIVDQTSARDVRCLDAARAVASQLPPVMAASYEIWLTSNVRCLFVPSSKAKGPAHARYLAARLYKDERYFMMIDSHTQFDQGWDAILIDQLRRIEKEAWPKSMLSYHPRDASDKQMLSASPPLELLCDVGFHPDWGVPIVFARKHITASTEAECTALGTRGQAIAQPLTCAGFLFARGSLLREVPFSADLAYVFHGEEILLTIRAFAKGWRAYHPCRTVLTHKYERVAEPSLWKDVSRTLIEEKQRNSYQGIQAALRLVEFNSSVPMATSKDIPVSLRMEPADVKAFWEYAHVDPVQWTMDRRVWNCRV